MLRNVTYYSVCFSFGLYGMPGTAFLRESYDVACVVRV